MLQVSNLKVTKGGRMICRVPNLVVERRQRVVVVGPNGSGKTTLLRVLSGLEGSFVGQCSVGVPMRQRIYVHQSPYLFRGSVMSNVTYGLSARGVDRKRRQGLGREWLDRFGVEHLSDRSTRSLSGGERRRIALARAFAAAPELLLLDEPLADLDAAGITTVAEAILSSADMTIVVCSPTLPPEQMSLVTVPLEPPTETVE